MNLAGVEIILNMRRKMDRMQREVNEFMQYVKRELARGLGDWEQRLNTALVPVGARRSRRTSTTAASRSRDDVDARTARSVRLTLSDGVCAL